MNAQLTHREARSLFFDYADEELAKAEQVRLRAHLDQCGDCRVGWDQYARTVASLRKVDRNRAPASFATQVLRRIRRRRPLIGQIHMAYAYRVPVESIIPVLLGVAVAAFLILAAP